MPGARRLACAIARLPQPMFRRKYLQFLQEPLAGAFVVACGGLIVCCGTRAQVRVQWSVQSPHFHSSSATRANGLQQMTCKRLHQFFPREARRLATARQSSDLQDVQDGRCSSRTHL